jgi:hypothetical protein
MHNLSLHRIRFAPGELAVDDYVCKSSAQHSPEHGLPPSDYDTKLIASRVEEAFKINKRMDGRGTE